MVSARAGSNGWWLLIPFICAWVWISVSGYAGLNGQDAYDYLRLVKAWLAWYQGAEQPRMAEHPHGYPITAALVAGLVGSPVLGLRLVSAFGFGAIILIMRHVLFRAGGDRGAVNAYVLLSTALCPFMLRHALVCMSDVPAIALLIVAFGGAWRWMRDRCALGLLVAMIAALIAFGFRLAAAPVVLVIAFWCTRSMLPRHWRTGVLMGLGAALVIGVLWWWPHLNTWIGQGPLAEWSLRNLFRTELHSDDGTLRYALPNVVFVLAVLVHPGFLPIGLLILPFFRRVDLRSAHMQMALSILFVYLLFIAGMPFQNDRVLLMGQPWAVIVLFPAFARARAALDRWTRWPQAIIAIAALVQVALFVRAMLPFMHQAGTERHLAARLNELSAVHIYTHGMGAAFDELCPRAEVTELWYRELDSFEPGSFIVVQPAILQEQWEGRPPSVNWMRAERQGVEPMGTFPGGWLIARIR